MSETPPKLDLRTVDDFYRQALSLAAVYTPYWTAAWPPKPRPEADAGVAFLRLFADLARAVTRQLNQVPGQRELAFLQFLGLSLRAPTLAATPLVFTLDADSAPVLVPAGTEVASRLDPAVVFRTLTDLTAVPATIAAAYSVFPDQDEYAERTADLSAGRDWPPFAVTGEASPFAHLLLLGDDALFAPAPTVTGLQVVLEGRGLLPEYFAQWLDGAGRPLRAEVVGEADGSRLTATFKDLPQAPPAILTDAVAAMTATLGVEPPGAPAAGGTGESAAGESEEATLSWVGVSPADGLRIVSAHRAVLPQIVRVTGRLAGAAILPDASLALGFPVDVANGAYPFGQTPQTEDAFYVSSADVFAKQGAAVTVSFVVRPIAPPAGAKVDVELSWEFWDGKVWTSLNASAEAAAVYGFVDNSGDLLANGPDGTSSVRFVCPAIEPTTVAGVEGLWLRVRIASGGYGGPAGAVAPPYLLSLGLAYSAVGQPPVEQVAYNAFDSSQLAGAPYLPLDLGTGGGPFLLLGLPELPAGETLQLYWGIAGPASAPLAAAPDALAWLAAESGGGWGGLEVADGTLSLARPGVVSFTVPSAVAPRSLFGQSLYWLAVADRSEGRPALRVQGPYPNPAPAQNGVVYRDEVLGSGDDTPSQTFTFSYPPVAAGEEVEVSEVSFPAAEEGPLVTARGAGQGRVWVRWQEVGSFALSGPASRHYLLDRQSGRITFGDGKRGRTAPRGADNMVAAVYRRGDGDRGNCPAGALTELASALPAIAGVTNPFPAVGGTAGDDNAQILAWGPSHVRDRGRAVTRQDFAALAVEADPRVLRATVVPAGAGEILVHVLAASGAGGLLEEVRQYLVARALPSLAGRLAVAGPDYRPLDLTVQVGARPSILPDLDDLTFEELVSGLVATIPLYNRQWTDFNESDPGITLLQLLAWIAETLLYRLNRVPHETVLDFLRLVAGATADRVPVLLAKLASQALDPAYVGLLTFLQGIEDGSQPGAGEIREAVVAFFRAPYLAVSRPDFAVLTLEANALIGAGQPRVARAVIQADADEVRVLPVSDRRERFLLPVFPNGQFPTGGSRARRTLVGIVEKDDPYPDLITAVTTYLAPRTLLGAVVAVEAPLFTTVDVVLALLCPAGTDLTSVVLAAAGALTAYLDPLTGGRVGGGWPYGEPPSAAAVEDVALQVPGVAAVASLELSLAPTVEIGVLATLGVDTELGWAPPALREPLFFRGLPWLRVLDVQAAVPEVAL